MFSTQKKYKIIRIVLYFSFMTLIGIGIDISHHSIDSNGAHFVPEQSIQLGKSNSGNEISAFDVDIDRDSRFATQLTGFRLMPVSDSNRKLFRLQTLPAHGNMTITSNADFATHDSWDGSGTKADPYIFESYSITTTGIAGITISNTDAYFIIQNVKLSGATNFGVGAVQLTNVTHGHLRNNTATNSASGFLLDTISNNSLSDNTAINNAYSGFRLSSSYNNTLNNNTASNNYRNGFRLSFANNNVLKNNIANSNGGSGFELIHSFTNTLNNNIASSNGGFGFYVSSSSNNIFSFNIIIDNHSYGIFIVERSSVNNIVSENKFIANNQGAIQAFAGGQFNNFSSNFWDDWTMPDNNQDGVVDEPYSIDGNANNQDAIPQAEIMMPPADDIDLLVDLLITFIVVVIFGLMGAVTLFLMRNSVSKRKTSNFSSDLKDNKRKQIPHQDVLHSVETLVQELDESEN